MNSNSTTLIWIVLSVVSLGWVLTLVWLYRLHRRFVGAFANLGSKKNLAETFGDYYNKVSTVHGKLENLQNSYDQLVKISTQAIQKTGIVRFNPFRDTGGDQSFVLALLDNHDNGFLMTSIHGREGTRVYIKPVEYGSSKYALSDEEKGALKAAINPALINRKVEKSGK